MSSGWESVPGSFPSAPRNVQVVSPFFKGAQDLKWDNVLTDPDNTTFSVVGVNVYRSDSTEFGPYHRLNSFPVGGMAYRDRTDLIYTSEVITWDSWDAKGDAPNDRRWVFRTQYPIARKGGLGEYAESRYDVSLTVDGVAVPVDSVFGRTGEITLINWPTYDNATNRWGEAVLPTSASSVEITYYRAVNVVPVGPDYKVWYRLSTVATDAATPSGLVETPLEYCQPHSMVEVETMDYIWREAIRRNNWILEQGGERVKVFTKKIAGVPCGCAMDQRTLEYSKKPSQRCKTCYGVGFVGGYDGPYDMIMGPDDAPRNITQTSYGRSMDHQYDVWVGPSPLLSQRDFVVKQTNERYSIGPVHRPSNRGNVLQQHFSLKYLDDVDIRYQVPVSGTDILPWPETRTTRNPEVPYPVGPDRQASPMETEKSNIPDEREIRGRTPTWENQNYVLAVIGIDLMDPEALQRMVSWVVDVFCMASGLL